MKGYYEKTLLDLRLSRSSIGCVLMSLLLSACGSTSSGQPELKPVEGWKDLKFGTAFDDALNSMPSFEWNPASLNGCYDKIALEGCTLFPDRDRAVLPLENGILYLPSLTFDKSGKLISVSSEYRNRGGINLSQCKDILQRTIDATVAEFGSLRWPKPTGDDRKGSKVEKTERGNSYRIWYNHDSFVAGQMRTHWEGFKLDDPRPIAKWNRLSYVSILGWHINTDGKGLCSVFVEYSLPEK